MEIGKASHKRAAWTVKGLPQQLEEWTGIFNVKFSEDLNTREWVAWKNLKRSLWYEDHLGYLVTYFIKDNVNEDFYVKRRAKSTQTFFTALPSW
jgi:hypothetical protein